MVTLIAKTYTSHVNNRHCYIKKLENQNISVYCDIKIAQ